MSYGLSAAEREWLIRRGLMTPAAPVPRKPRYVPSPPKTGRHPQPRVTDWTGLVAKCAAAACREPVAWSTLCGRYGRLCERHRLLASANAQACKARHRELDKLRMQPWPPST